VAGHVFMAGTVVLALFVPHDSRVRVSRRPACATISLAALHAVIAVVGLSLVATVRPAVFFPRYLFFLFPSYVSLFAAAMSLVASNRGETGAGGNAFLGLALTWGGSLVAVLAVAVLGVHPNAPLVWAGLVQIPQSAAALMLLAWLAAPLAGWRVRASCIGLAVAGAYSVVALASELMTAPVDRLFTVAVAIPLGCMLVVGAERESCKTQIT
jgi:hypothetical protein